MYVCGGGGGEGGPGGGEGFRLAPCLRFQTPACPRCNTAVARAPGMQHQKNAPKQLSWEKNVPAKMRGAHQAIALPCTACVRRHPQSSPPTHPPRASACVTYVVSFFSDRRDRCRSAGVAKPLPHAGGCCKPRPSKRRAGPGTQKTAKALMSQGRAYVSPLQPSCTSGALWGGARTHPTQAGPSGPHAPCRALGRKPLQARAPCRPGPLTGRLPVKADASQALAIFGGAFGAGGVEDPAPLEGRRPLRWPGRATPHCQGLSLALPARLRQEPIPRALLFPSGPPWVWAGPRHPLLPSLLPHPLMGHAGREGSARTHLRKSPSTASRSSKPTAHASRSPAASKLSGNRAAPAGRAGRGQRRKRGARWLVPLHRLKKRDSADGGTGAGQELRARAGSESRRTKGGGCGASPGREGSGSSACAAGASGARALLLRRCCCCSLPEARTKKSPECTAPGARSRCVSQAHISWPAMCERLAREDYGHRCKNTTAAPPCLHAVCTPTQDACHSCRAGGPTSQNARVPTNSSDFTCHLLQMPFTTASNFM